MIMLAIGCFDRWANQFFQSFCSGALEYTTFFDPLRMDARALHEESLAAHKDTVPSCRLGCRRSSLYDGVVSRKTHRPVTLLHQLGA